MGATTALAATRAEALEEIERASFDLIMTDLRMPDGGGVELHRDLAARHHPLAGRMIFVTGDTVAGPALVSLAVQGEAPRILEKPFSPADVAAAVQAALGSAATV